MQILGIKDIPGPNVYSHQPVLVMKLDLQDLAYRESFEIEGFNERLLKLLPGLHEHQCALGRAGGFIERLQEGTWFGHIVEHVALELTDAADISVNRGKTVSTPERGVFLVAVVYRSAAGMRVLLETAVELVQALVDGHDYDLASRIAEAKRAVQSTALGPSTQAIVDAAEGRGIPVTRVDVETSLVRLGWASCSRMVQATMSSGTSAVAVDIASNKDLTKRLLGEAGIPTPRGTRVTTIEEAVAALDELGSPVVVKPLDGNQGRGVSLNLHTNDEVREAFQTAQQHSRRVIVEQLFTGRDYRVLVINGRMVAASEKTPARVFGDGAHTVAELIAIENANPNRAADHSKPLSCIAIDGVTEACLRKHGRTFDTIPEPGEMVLLRESANLSTGGEARDATDEVHEDIRLMCERAARVVGLDICGLDVVVPDISQPYTSGGIIEVNAAPGIRMHEFPSSGQPRNAGDRIVEMLFPNGSNGRIPTIAITGTNGKTTTTRMIAHVLASAGHHVGMTTTDGIYIADKQVASGDMTGPWSARVVLSDPSVTAAVLETARGGIVRNGLGYDWTDVAVFTNIQPDHIGQDGIETVEDIYRIKRLVAERCREGGTLVLNADDERLAAMPSDRRVAEVPRNVTLFSTSPTNPVIERHLGSGGTAYVLHGDWIEMHRAEGSRRIVRVSSLGCTFNGTAVFQVANVMACIAACSAVGVPAEVIAHGLSTFETASQNDGRVNLYVLNGGVVIVDYGHNAPAISAIGGMLRHWPVERKTAVLGLPGDRADELVIAAARAAGCEFDRIIVREDQDLRGRRPGEISRMLRRAIAEKCTDVFIECISDEIEAVRTAIAGLGPGDVTVAFCERKHDVAAFLEQAGGRVATPVEVLDLLRSNVRIPA